MTYQCRGINYTAKAQSLQSVFRHAVHQKKQSSVQILDSLSPRFVSELGVHVNHRIAGTLAGVAVASLVLAGCASNSVGAGAGGTQGVASPTTGASQSAEAADEAAGGSSFESNALVTSDIKISITKQKVIKVGQKGNEYGEKPVIAFYYKITNVSGKKVTPLDWISNFKAYQDNNSDSLNELEIGLLPDDEFLESQTEQVKRGGTVKNAVAYELDDLKTPVDLVAFDDFGSSEIGRTSFEVK